MAFRAVGLPIALDMLVPEQHSLYLDSKRMPDDEAIERSGQMY
jgi:hypothetical protein